MLFFSRPQDVNKSFIVNYAPIFSNLRRSEKRLILKKSQLARYKKGALIYKQDDPADAFYCMITGRVKISIGRDQKKETLDFLTSGMHFGIVSLLTTKTHSANAEAVNDSLILRIDKDDFYFILDKIPKLAIELSRTLSQQIRSRDYARKVLKSNIVSIYSAIRGIGRTMYAANLAISLRRETKKKIIFLDISQSAGEVFRTLGIKDSEKSIDLNSSVLKKDAINNFIIKDPDLGLDFLNIIHNPTADNTTAQISPLLSLLTNDYQYIIVDLPVERSKAVFKVLVQSDDIHLITDYDINNLNSTRELMVQLFKTVEYPQEKIKIILNEKKGSRKIPSDEVVKLIDHDVFATLPVFGQAGEKINTVSAKAVLTQPDSEYARTIRRIARQIGDVLVGLALGSGAAFGLAHIGVIKVLERENIPIDIVAGTSMGAMVGAFWASGMSITEIESAIMEFNNKKNRVFRLFGDFCFPKAALIKGKRVAKFLKNNLGNKTFHDIKFPFKIIASNLDRREKVVFDSGKLLDAVRSSIAIPGVFRPLGSEGNLIVDGGILEPVPTETLLQSGVKKVIAINVLPSPEDIQKGYKDYKFYLEKKNAEMRKRNFIVKILYRLRLLLRKMLFPNIFDIMVNSLQAMEYVIAKENCRKADITINPVIPGMNWFEFFRAEELIKKGEEATEKAIAQFKDCINS